MPVGLLQFRFLVLPDSFDSFLREILILIDIHLGCLMFFCILFKHLINISLVIESFDYFLGLTMFSLLDHFCRGVRAKEEDENGLEDG